MKTPMNFLTGLAILSLLALTSCDPHRINEDTNGGTADHHGTNHVDRPTDAHGLGGVPASTDSTTMDSTDGK